MVLMNCTSLCASPWACIQTCLHTCLRTQVLNNHTVQCARRWRQQINFLTVDFWSIGETMRVVDEQNNQLKYPKPYWEQ